MRLPWRRRRVSPVEAAERASATAELILAVAAVFPHEEGQQLWWESYDRRSPELQAELVDDLHRRMAR